MIDADWSDLTEIQRTCAVTLVAFLAPARKFSMHEATEASFPEPITYPTVIYLHGCSGVWEDTYRRIDFLGENGFVLIVPLGFTRKKYPQSCETGNHREGMYSFDAGTAIQNGEESGLDCREKCLSDGVQPGKHYDGNVATGRSDVCGQCSCRRRLGMPSRWGRVPRSQRAGRRTFSDAGRRT